MLDLFLKNLIQSLWLAFPEVSVTEMLGTKPSDFPDTWDSRDVPDKRLQRHESRSLSSLARCVNPLANSQARPIVASISSLDTIFARTSNCCAPNALVEWRQLSSSPPPSQKQQEVPCNPRCLQLWPHCCKRETYRRDPKAVRSQDVENHLIQSDFGTLKLRPVLTGLLSNGKLGRKLLRTLETPLIRAKHVHSCQTQAQTLL